MTPDRSLSFNIKINSCFHISFEALVYEEAHVYLDLMLEGFYEVASDLFSLVMFMNSEYLV